MITPRRFRDTFRSSMIHEENAIWVLGMLESLLDKLGIHVRYEALAEGEGDGTPILRGGLCRLRGSWVVIVDRRLSPRKKCEVFIDALRQTDTSGVFVPPLVRQLIER